MDLSSIEGSSLYFYISVFRHNVTSTLAIKTSAVEGGLVSGVAQVNKVEKSNKNR